MEQRVFGRELTNLLEPVRPKRNYSMLAGDRFKDLKAPVTTRNRSIVIPSKPVPPTPVVSTSTDPQMVPEYMATNFAFMTEQ